jgi:hypothetical protein
MRGRLAGRSPLILLHPFRIMAHLKIRTGGFLPHTRWFVRLLLDHRQAPRPEERQKSLFGRSHLLASFVMLSHESVQHTELL